MKELFVRLGGALAIIGALAGGTWWLINGGDGRSGASAASDAGASAQTEPEPDAGASRPRVSGLTAAATLQQIGEASQRLLPDGYNGIFIGMRLSDLRAVRRGIQRSQQARAQGQLWEEDDHSGARVLYLLSQSELLEQVQFMSRLEGTSELAPHFTALQQRYGAPTGVWDCPETDEAPPLRRFTWRREGASMMEAVLIYGSTVSLTLVVAATEDIGAALQRSRCAPVQSAQQLAAFPVARELRGERSTFIRELPRDGG
ncbi:MAG: hypothetical protein U0269_24145 [Polyangiales bacterium]